MAEFTRVRGVVCEDAWCEFADGGGRAGCSEGDESAGNSRLRFGGRPGWDGIHTVDEEEYSYVSAYFVLLLLGRGRVVDRASGDADNERLWDAGERG